MSYVYFMFHYSRYCFLGLGPTLPTTLMGNVALLAKFPGTTFAAALTSTELMRVS